MASAGLIGIASPVAAAAHAVPWRFTTVTQSTSISGYGGAAYIKTFTLQCPAGYIPVSGGVIGPTSIEVEHLARIEEWPDATDGTYTLVLINEGFNGTALNLAVNCVWLDDVGTITYVYGHFYRNSTTGRAGGSASCLNNQLLLSAAVAWTDYTPNRTINFSTPITGGTSHAYGWFASGYSDISNSRLDVEMRCVDASLLSASYVEATDSSPGYGYYAPKTVCATGYRILTGGAGPTDLLHPTSDQGWATSGPYDTRQYTAFGNAETGIVMRAMAVCVPSSTISVQITQQPNALSNVRSGSITFTATDSAGETVTLLCYLDGTPWPCASGTPVNYGPLVDGTHYFDINAHNQYGSAVHKLVQWVIDATAPTIANQSPTTGLALTGAVTITFSEPVTGLTSSSVTVHAEAANVDVAGTIARPTTSTATWTPSSALVPGETYRFSFTNAIQDTAGNALTPTYFTVRTSTTVENSSSALRRYWDRDSSSIASGSSFIVSRLAGSRADLSFTAAAGQTVAVYGLRRSNGGYADIYLDGVKTATASFYASSTGRARVYLSGSLTAGSHTVSIRPTGTRPSASTGNWVAIDNVTYGTTTKQETSLRQVFPSVSSTSAYGGSYDRMDQVTETDANPARYQVTVVGTGVQVYATRTTTSGKARVYVDGVLKATIDLHATSTIYRALVYSGTFSLGVHVVRIDAVGTSTGSSSYFDVDRIVIT